ncbi:MAG: methylmalonyl-CoA mutase [Myxococcota bacterium]|jgi:methylmalonyl-CoA mutase
MDFGRVNIEAWRARVSEELRGRPLSQLSTALPGGVPVEPLYTAEDASGDGGLPGAAPYTRGAALWSAWDICPRHDDPRRDVLRASIVADLDGGAEGLWLQLDRHARLGGGIGEDGATLYSAADFHEVFAGRDLSKIHARLDAGAAALPLAAQWTALAARQGVSLSEARLRFCFDPAAALMRDGALPADLESLWSQAATLIAACEADLPTSRALTVSTGPIHQAGGDAPLELAVALSGVTEALSGLGGRLSAEQIAVQIELSVPMGRDIFLNIARLRALRTLWSHLLTHCGLAAVPPPDIHAFSAPITLSQRDPWTNMLRVTTQTYAAIVGGAQRVTPAAYDEALGQPDALGRRVARNTPIILREESHLGQVTDPAGGSHYVEALTEQLSAAAWGRFQELQARGGLLHALRSGWVHEQLRESWSERLTQIAHRQWPVTGVSTFPHLEEGHQVRFQRLPDDALPTVADEAPALSASSDLSALRSVADAGASVWGMLRALRAGEGEECPALPRHRDAAPFEALRDRADAAAVRPAVFLVTLGAESDWTPRANFAANLLAAAGIAVIIDPGPPTEDPQELAVRCVASGASAACICGTDEAYGRVGVAVAEALSGRLVLLAGRPDDALREGGVSIFIHLGCDALLTLGTLLAETGA